MLPAWHWLQTCRTASSTQRPSSIQQDHLQSSGHRRRRGNRPRRDGGDGGDRCRRRRHCELYYPPPASSTQRPRPRSSHVLVIPTPYGIVDPVYWLAPPHRRLVPKQYSIVDPAYWRQPPEANVSLPFRLCLFRIRGMVISLFPQRVLNIILQFGFPAAPTGTQSRLHLPPYRFQ